MSKPLSRQLPYPLLYAYRIHPFWAVFLLVSATALFLFGVLVFAHSLSNPSQSDSSLLSQLYKVNSAQATTALAVSAPRTTHLREMHIANNGAVFLKSAKITALSDKALSVSMSWGSEDFLWTVRYSYLTSVLDKNGKHSTLSGLKVGDTLTITGTLATDATEPSVDAQVIRKN